MQTEEQADQLRNISHHFGIEITQNGNISFRYKKWLVVVTLMISPWWYSYTPGNKVGISFGPIHSSGERLIGILHEEIAKESATVQICRALPMPIADEIIPQLYFADSVINSIMHEIWVDFFAQKSAKPTMKS